MVGMGGGGLVVMVGRGVGWGSGGGRRGAWGWVGEVFRICYIGYFGISSFVTLSLRRQIVYLLIKVKQLVAVSNF